MNILYIITGLGRGGAEKVLCDLADRVHDKGHKVKIIYFIGEAFTLPKNKNIEIKKVTLNNIFDLFNFYKKLRKEIKNFIPDVIHCHMFHANIILRLLRLIMPMKYLINSAHSSNEGGKFRMLLYRVTHNLADLTTNVSLYASQEFIKFKAVPYGEIKTIYNGVDFNKYKYDETARLKIKSELNLDPDKKIILSVARFNKAKNIPNLLLSIKKLIVKYDNFILLVAGDGELRKEIEELIEDYKLNNFIRLLGVRNDIPVLMSACDIFVLSSDYEGLPTVLIEALGCQSNIVSTDCSGVREIVDQYGSVVPIKNSDALSDALLKILLKDNLPRNIAGNIYVRDKFDLEKIAIQWINIYSEKVK